MTELPAAVATAISTAGGSLIADELKGDLAAARAAAESALALSPDSGDAGFAVGLVATLQGDSRTAALQLEAAREAGVESRLAGALLHLNRYFRWDGFPGGEGAGGFELTRQRTTEVLAQQGGPAYVDGAPGDPFDEARLVGEVLARASDDRRIIGWCRQIGFSFQLPSLLQDALAHLAPLEGGPWAAYADLAAADLLRRAGQEAAGRTRLQVAQARYESAGDAAGVGACLLAAGDWAAAPFSTPAAWNLALVASDNEGNELLPDTELSEGSPAGDPAAAATAYDAAAACFASAPRGLATIELRRAYLAELAGDAGQAVERAERARLGFEAAGDRLGERLALAHRLLGEIEAGAEPAGDAAAREIGAWGRSEGSFSYALALGLLFVRVARRWERRRSDPDRALAGYDLARGTFQALGTEPFDAQALVDMGQLLRSLGDWSSASLRLEEASALNERMLAVVDEEPALTMRQYFVAMQQRALAAARSDADGLERGLALLKGQRERVAALSDTPTAPAATVAVACIDETLEQTAVEIPLTRIRAERSAHHVWSIPAQRDIALAAASAATRGADMLRAYAYAAAGELDTARELLRRYLASPEAALPPRCGWSDSSARYVAAERAMQLAAMGLWEEADGYFASLEHDPGPNWWAAESSPWVVLDTRGEVHEGCDRLAAALETYEQSIEQLERTREHLTPDELRSAQTGLLAANRPFLHAARAAQRAAEAGGVGAQELRERSFSYAERGRARALLDVMATNAVIERAPASDQAWTRRWRQLQAAAALGRGLLVQARLAGDAARAAELEGRLAASEDELRALESARPRWRDIFRSSGAVLTASEVAAHVAPGTVVLEYLLDDRHLLGWAVEHDGLTGVHQRELDRDSLAHAINDFCVQCQSGSPKWAASAQQLAEILLAPFAAQIERSQRVVFVPSGAVHRMPLHVLTWQGQPLGADREVTMLPSASALAYLAPATPPPPGPVLAVGGPTEMTGGTQGGQMRDLPWSAAEAAWIASRFAGSKLLVGGAATETAVRERIEHYPILHFASHAAVADAPLASELLLASGEQLSLYELLGLDLSAASLVVLSACETARGEVTTGEEVIGLTRGILAAGAGGVVASLWKVNAHSTPLFMRAFYSRLLDGDAPSTALRAAREHMRGLDEATAAHEREELQAAADANGIALPPVELLDYSHPDHWSPFVLVGA